MTNWTHYDVLELPRSATPAEIKAAYRRLAMQWHPDRNKQPCAAARFREINDAYHMLSNPILRALYDAELEALEEQWRAEEESERARQAEADALRLLAEWQAKFRITPERLFAMFARAEAWMRRR